MFKKTVDSVIRSINNYPWYHSIDLGDGLKTPGQYDLTGYLDNYGIPEDLTGKRVLDLGTSDGFFAFEMEKRGAKEIFAIDSNKNKKSAFNFCKKMLGSKAKFYCADIYDLDQHMFGGKFDFVFCGSLLLHLDDIVGAIKKIKSITNGTALIASGYIDHSEGIPLFLSAHAMHSIILENGPKKGMKIDYPVTWFGNKAGYEKLLKYAGFENIEVVSTFNINPNIQGLHSDKENHGGTHHIAIKGDSY